MSDLTAVGEQDNWICWLCDKPVDPDASVNSDLGPSTDSFAATRVKKGAVAIERLAHRQCNTQKGKISPVVPWSKDVFVVDPSPIFETVERLRKKEAGRLSPAVLASRKPKRLLNGYWIVWHALLPN